MELLVKQCVELSVYIFYSPAALPIEPDSASESIVFGTVLYCKSCPRYDVLGEIRLLAAS